MITENLKQLVRKEAELLLIHATEQEMENLDFGELIPRMASCCIYGQMTGSCFSERSYVLKNKCATFFSGDTIKFEKITKGGKGFTAIEFYICQDGSNNKGLIDFLKDKSKYLSL